MGRVGHERAGFDNGDFMRHRSNCQCNFGGNIVVGDFENGNIYRFDLDVYADNGGIQKWLRSWRALPTGQNNLKRTAHHSLQLDCETGVGLNDGQGRKQREAKAKGHHKPPGLRTRPMEIGDGQTQQRGVESKLI